MNRVKQHNGYSRDAGALVGQGGASRKVRALVSECEPKNGDSVCMSGNCLVPRPLDWLKMILRMFQLTETMFFWGFLAISIVLVVKVIMALHEQGTFPSPLLAKGRRGACLPRTLPIRRPWLQL